jgi:hypothetical protein
MSGRFGLVYYNWLERRWDTIDHDRKLTREQKEQIARRQRLLDDVILEIEQSSDSVRSSYMAGCSLGRWRGVAVPL